MNPSAILIFALPLICLIALRVVYRSGAIGWPRLLLGNLLLLGFLTSLILLGAEVYYRYIYDESDGFAIGLTSERWFERHYRYNNRGIRDNIDYADELPANRTRITFLGDSYTNGHGIKDVDDRFVNQIRQAHPDWDVHFIGGDGYDTGILLESLSRWISEGYKIDRVVYIYCPNDISDLMQQWQQTTQQLYEEKPGFPFSGSYALNTYYYRYKAKYDPALHGYFDAIAAAYNDAHWLAQTRRLEQLAQWVEQAGGELEVVLFPFIERIDDPSFEAIAAQLRQFWKEREVPFLDLSETYRSQPIDQLIVNRHDTHANEHGHDLAAGKIDAFLTRTNADRVEANR